MYLCRSRCPHGGIRLLLVLVCTTALYGTPAKADPIQFQFGISSSITVVQNTWVFIPAAIINAGTSAMEFDTDAVPPNVGATFHPPSPGWAVDFDFGPGTFWYDQFAGLTLDPGDRFDFMFGRLNVLSTPLGVLGHPRLGFEFEHLFASNQPTVIVGTTPAFSPLVFVDSEPVPEPGTWLLIGSGMAYLLRRRRTART